jgi:hypothetical protein
MQSNSHPLDESHYQEIMRGLAAVTDGLNQVQKAKLAGIDLSAVEQELRAAQEKLTQIRNVYFPGRG